MFDYRSIDDPKQVLTIANSAFAMRWPERQAAEEWLAIELSHGRKLYGVYSDQQLLSAYLLLNYDMRLRESVVPMGGIGLLCSRLDARGKGAVRHMLSGALQTMRDGDSTVSVLDPFSESFYRKYGWEKFTRMHIHEFGPGALSIPDDHDATVTATDLSYPDEACKTFYNDYAAKHYNLAQRACPEWDARTRLLEWSQDTSARGVVRFSQDDQVVGLLGYDLSRKPDEHNATFTANLVACERADVFREMLRYIARLSHQVSKVKMTLAADQELWPYLSHRPETRTVRDVFMIRVVSMQSLDGLKIQSDDFNVCIDVEDAQAPWNAGLWNLSIDGGVLRVSPGQEAELACGIGALSSVIAGFTTFEDMLAAGKATAYPSYKGQDLPLATTFLADYF